MATIKNYMYEEMFTMELPRQVAGQPHLTGSSLVKTESWSQGRPHRNG
jgi:hypothetical protein